MEKLIKNIYLECKTSNEINPSLIQDLTEFYLKGDFEEFQEKFIYLVKCSLIDKEKIVFDRISIFICTFMTSVSLEEKNKELDTMKPIVGEKNIDTYTSFISSILEYLLKNHEAKSPSVGYRVCCLMNKILVSVKGHLSLRKQLQESFNDAMTGRLMDKIPAIRLHAIYALHHFQDIFKDNCPIINTFRFHLSLNPSIKVRKAILNYIVITPHTLPEILNRRKDVNDSVRTQAYFTLAERVHIKSLSLVQRLMVIDEGLKDRSRSVRLVVRKKILPAWLEIANGSVLELLDYLDVVEATECAESAVNILLEDFPSLLSAKNFHFLNEEKLIPYDELTPESAFYWICLIKCFRWNLSNDTSAEDILPKLSIFCDYIFEYAKIHFSGSMEEDSQEQTLRMTQSDFICEQLIDMIILFTLTDEIECNRLRLLIHQLLVSTYLSERCIKALFVVFPLLYPSSQRENKIKEIISEIREFSELNEKRIDHQKELKNEDDTDVSKMSEALKIKLGQIRFKMKWMQDEVIECVRDLNIGKAVELKDSLKKLEKMEADILEEERNAQLCATKKPVGDKEDSVVKNNAILHRCLITLCCYLSRSNVTEFGPTSRTLLDSLILPCIQSENLMVRKFAVRSLSLCCRLSKEFAKQHFERLNQLLKLDVENIQTEALQGLFDIWLLFGLDEFYWPPIEEHEGASKTEQPHLENMNSFFSNILVSTEGRLRRAAVKGLCKLILASHVRSSTLLSHLLLLLYTPTTEKDMLLRNILAAFFPLFAKIRISNQETVAKSFLPLFCDDFNGPFLATLSEFNLEEMIRFLITLTSPVISRNNIERVCNIHISLAHNICTEILTKRNERFERVFVSSLNNLVLTNMDQGLLQEIFCLSFRVMKEARDEVTKQYAKKFYRYVQDVLRLPSGTSDRSSSLLEEAKALKIKYSTEQPEHLKIEASPELKENNEQSPEMKQDNIQSSQKQENNEKLPEKRNDIAQTSQLQEDKCHLPEMKEDFEQSPELKDISNTPSCMIDDSQDEKENFQGDSLMKGGNKRASRRLKIMKQNRISSKVSRSKKRTEDLLNNSKSFKSIEKIEDFQTDSLENSPQKKVPRNSGAMRRKREHYLSPEISPPSRSNKRKVLKDLAQDFGSESSPRTSTPYLNTSDYLETNTRVRQAKIICNEILSTTFGSSPPLTDLSWNIRSRSLGAVASLSSGRSQKFSKRLEGCNTSLNFSRDCKSSSTANNISADVPTSTVSRKEKRVIKVLHPTALIEFT